MLALVANFRLVGSHADLVGRAPELKWLVRAFLLKTAVSRSVGGALLVLRGRHCVEGFARREVDR
jgi:hypothetical protein